MITLIKKTTRKVTELSNDELKQISYAEFPMNQFKLITSEMIPYLSDEMFSCTWNNTKFPFDTISSDVWIKCLKNSHSCWHSVSYNMLSIFPREFIEQNLSLIIDNNFGGYSLGSWLVSHKYINLSDYKKYDGDLNFDFSELCGPNIDRADLLTYLKESPYLYIAIDDDDLEDYPILLHNAELKELGLNEIPELSIELLKKQMACNTGIRYASKVLSLMGNTSTTWDNFVDFLHANPEYFERDLIAWIFRIYNESDMFDSYDFKRD